LNLPNPFEDNIVQTPSSCWANISRIFIRNTFEKRQEVTCSFSKEFCENLGNLPTNRKKGMKILKVITDALPEFQIILQIQNR
jgi:hypothetical protein